MENIYIEATKYTPLIELDTEKGVINIRGKSYPENTFEFYEPVLNRIEAYLKEVSGRKIALNLQIQYFNSTSSKVFFDLFDMFEEACDENEIEVNWIYHPDNDSVKDAGEDFVEDFDALKINLVADDAIDG